MRDYRPILYVIITFVLITSLAVAQERFPVRLQVWVGPTLLHSYDSYTGPTKLSGGLDGGAVVTLSRHFGLRIRFAYTNVSLAYSGIYGPPDEAQNNGGLMRVQKLQELPRLYRFSMSLQYRIPLDHNGGRTSLFSHLGLGTSYLSGGWSRVSEGYLSEYELSREPVLSDSPYATARSDATLCLGCGVTRRIWRGVSLEIACGVDWANIPGTLPTALYPGISSEEGVDYGAASERNWTRTVTEIRLGLSYGIGGMN